MALVLIHVLANRTIIIIIARMIHRTTQEEILSLLEDFPAVAILGPRQVGKTTLAEEIAKSISPEPLYLDLSTYTADCYLPTAYFFSRP